MLRTRFLRWFVRSFARSLVGTIVRSLFSSSAPRYLSSFVPSRLVLAAAYRRVIRFVRARTPAFPIDRSNGTLPHPRFQHRSASSSSLPCVRYHSPPSPSLAPHPPRARLPFACVGPLSSSLSPCPGCLIVAAFALPCILLFLDFRPSKTSSFSIFIILSKQILLFVEL